ncbi:MAG: hypothetical protein AAGD35_19410 [Actinomycetota bacterium]
MPLPVDRLVGALRRNAWWTVPQVIGVTGLTAAFGTWQVWAAMAALNTACVLAFTDDLAPRPQALFQGSALAVIPLGLALPFLRRGVRARDSAMGDDPSVHSAADRHPM